MRYRKHERTKLEIIWDGLTFGAFVFAVLCIGSAILIRGCNL
jgi:hypothetical protein